MRSLSNAAHRPEDKYIKLPAIIHATRLGYAYRSIHGDTPGVDYDSETNIFYELLRQGLEKVNHQEVDLASAIRVATELRLKLSAPDLGREFFHALQTSVDGLKLIDFKDPRNNVFTVVTELEYRSGDDCFRPDIIFLVNGMPLAFMEAKRQNNKDGVIAERERMYKRFSNPIYQRFVNITQVMAFSNNQEYDDESRQPLHGSFYASSAYGPIHLNHMREEDQELLATAPAPRSAETERGILQDNGLASFFGASELESSIDPLTPANRIVTSLFTPERFIWLLRYGLCYVEKANEQGVKELQKHVMRYPQLFATHAVARALESGADRGVIWHTQGSGKTALAFFLSRYLRDICQRSNKIAEFFFIVDRLDLADQAADEFLARGVAVSRIDTRKQLSDAFRPGAARLVESVSDARGIQITVVNIQKFADDPMAIEPPYGLNIQRIFFMDEAHRDYRPGGSFLASLMNADRGSIKIALTGTPLIEQKKGKNTRDVFGPYFHKYFYNQSIADGYTLRLLRESVKTEFKVKMRSIAKNLKELKSIADVNKVFEHPHYVEPLCDYITDDFLETRIRLADDTIGAMIVANSSGQARAIYARLLELDPDISCALVLHDEGTKESRKDIQQDFKRGSIDILVVYNMLLTGFDAPRLKKLYLCRKIRQHNLLQALTRVNRPYKDHPFGYVVDFADITEEYDKTNRAYFKELQDELGDASEEYSSIFADPEQIESDLRKIKDVLFLYSTEDVVRFQQQINALQKKANLYELRAVLTRYRELRNVAAMYGYENIYAKFDLSRAAEMLREVEHRIDSLNAKEALAREDLSTGAINVLLSQLRFSFSSNGSSELKMADEYHEAIRHAFEAAAKSLDPKDPEYISLLEELKQKLRAHNVEEMTSEEMATSIKDLKEIRSKLIDYNERDRRLAETYGGDAKFVRVHKRALRTPPPLTNSPSTLHGVLLAVKNKIDDMISANYELLGNPQIMVKRVGSFLASSCRTQSVGYKADQIKSLSSIIVGEYETEKGRAA